MREDSPFAAFFDRVTIVVGEAVDVFIDEALPNCLENAPFNELLFGKFGCLPELQGVAVPVVFLGCLACCASSK